MKIDMAMSKKLKNVNYDIFSGTQKNIEPHNM